MAATSPLSPILVKRYARSRLYAPEAATVDELRRWRNAGIAFVVVDAETGDDVTRILLA